LASNATPEGREINRRVEVILVPTRPLVSRQSAPHNSFEQIQFRPQLRDFSA